ncbi:MAG: hypothetical protein K5895_07685, partial [Lachnospiraceae bacterium]|nr:hypothetical protein [Lachnospiraceae bacterium]
QLDTTDNKYYITLTTSGLSTLDKEVTITAIGKTAGIVLQKTIKVEKVATPSKVVFGAINKAVVAVGDTVAIDVTVYDQFGDVMTPDKYVSSGIVLGKTGALATATSVGFDDDKTSKTYGKVLLDTANAAVNNGSVTATLGTTTFTKDITVKDARVVSSVIKANDVTLIQGASKKLAFKFQDQYGEEIETVADNSTESTGYSVTITKNSGDDAGLTKNLTSGTNESDLNDIEVFSVANATGKYTVTVALTNANGTIASATTVVTVVSDVAEGLTYSIVDLKTVVADAAHAVDGTDPYAQVITIKATDANGNEVVIPAEKIINVGVEGTNASTYFQVGLVAKLTPETKVDAQEGQYVLAAKATAVEATAKDAVVVAQINTSKGIQLVKSNVLTFTNEAPKAVEFFLTDGDTAPSFVDEPTKFVGGKTSFTFADTVAPASLSENLYLVQKDQYGVYKTILASNMELTVNTPNSIVGTVALNNGKIEGTINDYSVNKDITLSFVSGGVAKTFTVKFEKTIGDVTASLNGTTLTFSRGLSAASAAKVITQLESDESIASVTTSDNKVFTISYASEKDHSNIASGSKILNKSDVIDICGNASVADVTIADNTGL